MNVVKKAFVASTLAGMLSIIGGAAFAHHMAADIVDEEIYAMIDSLVADTPHADLTFEDMGSAMETDITFDSVQDLETMVSEGGLLTYVAELDGDVTTTLSFAADGSVTLSVLQVLEE